MADGDSIYAASAGEVEADLNVAGTLAAYVMEQCDRGSDSVKILTTPRKTAYTIQEYGVVVFGKNFERSA